MTLVDRERSQRVMGVETTAVVRRFSDVSTPSVGRVGR
jgi:hypothetical protein